MASVATKEGKYRIVTRNEWLEKRLELLTEEKRVAKEISKLNEIRRSLPMHECEDYILVGKNGNARLSDLFEGEKTQLVVYHMMMADGAESGCSLCSFFIDHFLASLPHLQQRVSFAIVAKNDYSKMMKWVTEKKANWDENCFYSSKESSFSENFQVAFTKEQMESKNTVYNYIRTWNFGSTAPGISVFYKKVNEDGTFKIYHTYDTYSAGLGNLVSGLTLLDLTPEGRNEKTNRNMYWVKHKESY